MLMVLSFIFVLGLIFGSFINALVWRVHTKRKWWGNERSICPKCKHKLYAVDLIPVLSWLLLKGKCRYCKKPISVQYPLVELITAILFVVSYMAWPIMLSRLSILVFIVWLFSLVLMVALCVYDYKWMILPNIIVVILTISSLIFVVLKAIDHGSINLFLQACLASIIFFGLFWFLFIVSSERWIGGGDVKLAVSLGLFVGGVAEVFLVIFLASLIGTVYVLPKLATGKVSAKTHIPFGPLLMVATIIVVLFGKSLIDWYLHSFLHY